jgi:Raf kinase inhibitor-like YbhB/YbcL family protein
MAFTVISNSFKDGDYLRNDFILSADFRFGCAGGNKSSHLKWSGAPDGTKSFAVTCYDPDAPTGSGFWHWLVANIPANVSELAESAGSSGGKLPAGALQTRTDFGAPGYGGPCPPQGDHPHRYLFMVFAVKTDKLDVKAETSAQSRRERKNIEMRFAHMKRIFRLDRLRLRGLSGVRDEVLLTAIFSIHFGLMRRCRTIIRSARSLRFLI